MDWKILLSNGWDIVSSIVTVASIVALATKTDADNKVVAFIAEIVHKLSLNSSKTSSKTSS